LSRVVEHFFEFEVNKDGKQGEEQGDCGYGKGEDLDKVHYLC